MIVSWLVYCLLVSALVSAAAWLGERASRAQGWPVRWAWAAALAATVGFPIWAWLAPSPEPAAAGPLPGALVMEALPPLVLQPTSPAPGLGFEDLLLLGWAAASGLLLLWLAVSVARLRVAERGWGAEELDGVRVLVSERTGPAAMGVVRGRVVLPRWALALDGRLRRLMVLHEAEHVRAGDPQLAVAGLLVCALMPWNLPVWWQLARLRLAIEVDCDARVLRRSGDVRGYGALLLEVGQRRRARLAVGLAETRSSLERRIRMMTETTTGRRTLRALGLAAVSGAVLAMACETPGPTEVATAPERRPVTLEQIEGMGSECEPLVLLNGETRITLDEARAAPENIETIHVFKGPKALEAAGQDGECGVILIVTKDATPAEQRAVRAMLARVQEPVERRTIEEMAQAPTFTPMTRRPVLKDPEQVRTWLEEQYPPLLKDAGIGGTANVWFFIDDAGRVQKLQVNRSSGHPALDQAALRVAGGMEFEPAELDGNPVPVWVALDITFEPETGQTFEAREVERAAAGGPPPGQAGVRAVTRAERLRLEAARMPPPPPSATAAEVADRPVFTPMTVRPQLRNAKQVQELLMAHYPVSLRDRGIGGTVNTWFLIDEAGRVVKTAVNTSSGYDEFDAAALEIAGRMEFTPAYNRDQAVPVWVAIDITFDVMR